MGLIALWVEADFVQGSRCGKLELVAMQSDGWAGFVWYNMDDDCGPMRDYLGQIADQIDTYPMTKFKRMHWVMVQGDFNWKLVQTKFSECNRARFQYPDAKYTLDYASEEFQFDHYPHGHCRMFMSGGGPAAVVKGCDVRCFEQFGD